MGFGWKDTQTEKAPRVVYQPDNALRRGYRGLLADIAAELAVNRWLILQLFKRDCLALYQQSFIGIFWAFLVPIISAATFAVLNNSGVLMIGEIDVPYPVYAVAGLALWQLFAAGLIASSNSLVKAGSMVAKINFSRKALVIASTGTAVVAFLVQMVLLGALFGYYGIWPGWRTLALFAAALPVLALTLGLGFVLALLNGVVRDVGNALSIGITFLMFLTPILYAGPESGLVATVADWNPIYYLVTVPRDFVFDEPSLNWRGYAASFVAAAIALVVGLVSFHLTEPRVTERI